MSKHDLIDWALLASDFERMVDALTPVPVPDEAEIQQHFALARRGRLAESPVPEKVKFDHYVVGHAEFRKKIRDFNLDARDGFKRRLSTHRVSCLEVVRECIASEKASTDFILAWGYLAFLTGARHELVDWEHTAEQTFVRAVAGYLNNVDLQRCWHARWILQHTGSDRKKRLSVENELAALCTEIWRGEREVPKRFERK
jgi:hypothetical protein